MQVLRSNDDLMAIPFFVDATETLLDTNYTASIRLYFFVYGPLTEGIRSGKFCDGCSH